MSQALMTGLLN